MDFYTYFVYRCFEKTITEFYRKKVVDFCKDITGCYKNVLDFVNALTRFTIDIENVNSEL